MDYNAKPRYVGFYEEVYGRGQLSARDNMEAVRGYLSKLDPTFFDKIFNYDQAEMTDEDATAIAQEVVSRYGTDKVFNGDVPNTVDELYQGVSRFVSFIMSNNPEKFRAMLAEIKSDHSKQYSKYKEKHLDPAKARIADMRAQRRARAAVMPAEGSAKENFVPPPPATSNGSWFMPS